MNTRSALAPFNAKDPNARPGRGQPSAKGQGTNDLESLTNKLDHMAGALPEGPLSDKVKSLRDRARYIREHVKAGMVAPTGTQPSKDDANWANGGASPSDELMHRPRADKSEPGAAQA